MSRITVYLPQAEYGALTIREATGNIEVPKVFWFGCTDISLRMGEATFCASADGSTSIKTTTGGIRVENIAADSLNLTVTTGSRDGFWRRNLRGRRHGRRNDGQGTPDRRGVRQPFRRRENGALFMERVVAAQQLTVRHITGSVHFDSCDAAVLSIETSTGGGVGSLLTEKVFAAETATGKIDGGKGTTGSLREIKTATGSIRMNIAH